MKIKTEEFIKFLIDNNVTDMDLEMCVTQPLSISNTESFITGIGNEPFTNSREFLTTYDIYEFNIMAKGNKNTRFVKFER